MRIRFFKRQKRPIARLDAVVLLVDELRDFCVTLLFSGTQGGIHRTAALCAHVQLSKALNGEISDQDMLLKPLRKLRHLQSVTIEGKSSADGEGLLGVMEQKTFDEELVISTIEELIYNGDEARDNDLYDVGTVYYQRAHEYYDHFANHHLYGEYIFGQTLGNVSKFEFKIMQHRALNWILDGDSNQAFRASNLALDCANMLFRIGAPPNQVPPTKRRDKVGRAARRKWDCQRVKEGAGRTGQIIKAEDIGRCYYYRGIARHVLGGDKAAEEADNDKMAGIGCCEVSDTMGDEDVPKELLEFDKRAMENLKSGSSDERCEPN